MYSLTEIYRNLTFQKVSDLPHLVAKSGAESFGSASKPRAGCPKPTNHSLGQSFRLQTLAQAHRHCLPDTKKAEKKAEKIWEDENNAKRWKKKTKKMKENKNRTSKVSPETSVGTCWKVESKPKRSQNSSISIERSGQFQSHDAVRSTFALTQKSFLNIDESCWIIVISLEKQACFTSWIWMIHCTAVICCPKLVFLQQTLGSLWAPRHASSGGKFGASRTFWQLSFSPSSTYSPGTICSICCKVLCSSRLQC